MEFKIYIDDEKLTDFSLNALNTLESGMEKYASDIIDEANRIETGYRRENAKKEVTSSFIEIARTRYKYTYKKKETRWQIAKKILSDVLLAASGILGSLALSPDNNSRLLFSIFSLCCAFAVVFTISKYVN